MQKLWDKWVRWRAYRAADEILANAIAIGLVDHTEPTRLSVARRLSDDRLHEIAGQNISQSARSIVERELRRREQSPTRRIAYAAFVVSLVSLALSMFKP